MITLFIYIYYIISRYGWTCYVQFSCDYTTREKKTTTKKARENVETTWNSTSGYDMPHQRHWQLWRTVVRGSAVWLTVCHSQPCCLEGRLFTALRSEVQNNYLWYCNQSGVNDLLIMRDPHYVRMCFKSVKTIGALHSWLWKRHRPSASTFFKAKNVELLRLFPIPFVAINYLITS